MKAWNALKCLPYKNVRFMSQSSGIFIMWSNTRAALIRFCRVHLQEMPSAYARGWHHIKANVVNYSCYFDRRFSQEVKVWSRRGNRDSTRRENHITALFLCSLQRMQTNELSSAVMTQTRLTESLHVSFHGHAFGFLLEKRFEVLCF